MANLNVSSFRAAFTEEEWNEYLGTLNLNTRATIERALRQKEDASADIVALITQDMHKSFHDLSATNDEMFRRTAVLTRAVSLLMNTLRETCISLELDSAERRHEVVRHARDVLVAVADSVDALRGPGK